MTTSIDHALKHEVHETLPLWTIRCFSCADPKDLLMDMTQCIAKSASDSEVMKSLSVQLSWTQHSERRGKNISLAVLSRQLHEHQTVSLWVSVAQCCYPIYSVLSMYSMSEQLWRYVYLGRSTIHLLWRVSLIHCYDIRHNRLIFEGDFEGEKYF